MDTINNSAIFFTAMFLFSCSFIVLFSAILVINNLLYRYWKNLGWTVFQNSYQESLKLNEPKLEKQDGDHSKA